MPFNLSLRFTGLCGFVSPDMGRMDVILVDALHHSHGTHHEEHYALIVTPYRHVTAEGRPPTFGFDASIPGYSSQKNELFAAFVLDKEDVTIPSLTGGVSPTTPEPVQNCPGASRVFGWISRMSDAGAGTIRKAVLSGPSNDVLGRVRVGGGALRTLSFAKENQSGNILKWQFKDQQGQDPKGSPRALAEVVELSALDIAGTPPGPNERFRLSLSNFNGGAKREIVLAPRQGLVVVWVLNIPIWDVISDRRRPTPGPDHHFAHMHRLAAPPSGVHIPHPNPPNDHCGPEGFIGPSNPKCPPTYFGAIEP